MPRDIGRDLDKLAGRPDNIKSRELEKVAQDAGWTHRRTTGSHFIYTKAGARRPLPIPRRTGSMKRGTALGLIRIIRESL